MRVSIFFLTALLVFAQSQQAPTRPTGVIRLKVRVKVDDAAKPQGLARKRFFLIPGTREQNRMLIEAIESQPLATRDCYYKKLGASVALIDWLKAGDCESVYCRSVEKDFITGPKAVPEFANAFAASQKEFGGDETGQKWLTTNLTPDVRDGFYRDRQKVLQMFLKQAGTTVQSVMTDRNGTAYFTDLGPGAYIVSNLIPTEFGQKLLIWNCDVELKPDEVAAEKPYQISNRKGPQVKCVAIEKPMPTCP